MAHSIFLPNNFTYDWTMPNCTENCAEKWQIASEGTALMIKENCSQFEKKNILVMIQIFLTAFL